MKLYLVRHGDALPEEVDPERPLSEQGQKEIDNLAEILVQRGLSVGTILHSGKTRAAQTAERLAARLLPAKGVLASGNLAPLDPVRPMADRIAAMADDTMMVGHLPFVGKLVSLLVTGKEDSSTVDFKSGGLVCLKREEDGNWTVDWTV